METCRYEVVQNKEMQPEVVNNIKEESHTYIIRQLIICSAVWALYFQAGMGVGAPTVFIPQLRREANSSAAVSTDMASWISSAFYIGALPQSVIIPIVAEYFGRKKAFLFVILFTVAAFGYMYFSTEVYHLLISQLLIGTLMAALAVSIAIVSEYTSPKHRGLFLNIKGASFYWGILASNLIGTYFHWSNIPIFALVVSLYIFLVIIFILPESPYWLASKGRFDVCVKAQNYLKGTGVDSENELKCLLSKNKEVIGNSSSSVMTMIKSKEFTKPLWICTVLLIQYNSTGKFVYTVYAIDIIRKVTNNESTAYAGMLILDGITIMGMYAGSMLSKYFNRRTILFISSSMAITLLFVLSAYLYLIKLSIIQENPYLSITLLLLFSVIVCVGPITLCTTLIGELASVKYRTASIILLGTLGVALLAVYIQTAPFIFRLFHIHGAFLFYGLLTLMCTIVLYKYMPETRDKILQDIEDSMK